MHTCPICLKERKIYPIFIDNNGTEFLACIECKENFFNMVMSNQEDMKKGLNYIKARLPYILDINFRSNIKTLIKIVKKFL